MSEEYFGGHDCGHDCSQHRDSLKGSASDDDGYFPGKYMKLFDSVWPSKF